MIDDRIVTPSWLFRLLGIQDVRFSTLEDGLILSDERGGSFHVDVATLGAKNVLREGIFFSELTVNTSAGVQQLKWLSKRSARSDHQWLRAFWYRKIAPEVSSSASEIRQITGLGYLRDSRFQRIRKIAIAQKNKFRDLPPKDWLDKHLLDDFGLVYDLASWGTQELEANRERYLQSMKIRFASYFDQIENNLAMCCFAQC